MKALPALLLALFSTCALASAGEVEIDLTKKPRIYTTKDVTCEAAPDATGSGIRFNYNFENATNAWANCEFTIPAIESMTKITVVAKGTAGTYSFALRTSQPGQTYTYSFGPTNEDDFQTFELNPLKPQQLPRGADAVTIAYPVSKIFFQIRPRSNPQGYLEISKLTIETQ